VQGVFKPTLLPCTAVSCSDWQQHIRCIVLEANSPSATIKVDKIVVDAMLDANA
jgi:hypothetical protein